MDGAQRSARPNKPVDDWRAVEAWANSQFPNRQVGLHRSCESGSRLNQFDFFFSLAHPLQTDEPVNSNR
jgi:hypothetical protein